MKLDRIAEGEERRTEEERGQRHCNMKAKGDCCGWKGTGWAERQREGAGQESQQLHGQMSWLPASPVFAN